MSLNLGASLKRVAVERAGHFMAISGADRNSAVFKVFVFNLEADLKAVAFKIRDDL